MAGSLRELVDEKMAGKSPGTRKLYLYWLEKLSAWLEADGGDIFSLTRADVQQFVAHLSARKKASTITTVVSAIRAFAHWTNQEHAVHGLRFPRPPSILETAPKSLDRRERLRLLRAVEREGNLRNIAIVYVLLYTGLRVSELCSLSRDDVVIRERSGHVHVRNTKNQVSRTVPLPSEARYHLLRYLAMRTDDHPALFLSNLRRPLSVRQVQEILKRYGVHPHTLRHTYIRTLIEQGVDIATVAQLAGHKDINITRRYAKPTFEEMGAAVENAFS